MEKADGTRAHKDWFGGAKCHQQGDMAKRRGVMQ